MRTLLATTLALALVSPALAAAPRHHAQTVTDPYPAYGRSADQQYAAPDYGSYNRVPAQDPDLNIRSQILRDQGVNDY